MKMEETEWSETSAHKIQTEWSETSAHKIQTEWSKTSAHKIQTLVNHPKERILYSQHSESLKSRKILVYSNCYSIRLFGGSIQYL
jgi:plasmid maintenance system killer protein